MSRKQVILLVTGIILVHLVFFWAISGTDPLPKSPYIPPPNFVAKEASWVDKETGEKMTYREFKVSTKLSMPDALMEKK